MYNQQQGYGAPPRGQAPPAAQGQVPSSYGYPPAAAPAAAAPSGYGAPQQAPAYASYGAGAAASYGGGYVPAPGGVAPGGWAAPAPQGGGGGWGGGAPPPVPQGGRFAVVRLRGLPFGVRDYEVALFLGLEPVDVLVCQRGGRPSGEAFAVLGHPSEADAALRRNRAYLGSRYVEVFEARKSDYYRAIAEMHGGGGRGGSPGPGGGGGRGRSRSPSRGGSGGPVASRILKLRGLPFSATEEDIAAFFDDPALGIDAPPAPGDVLVAAGADGRPSGMAFVEFPSAEGAGRGLGKDRALIGSRYIEVFPSTEDERGRHTAV
jgi:heterogeneous nuclear ribonucleoprotein F/H